MSLDESPERNRLTPAALLGPISVCLYLVSFCLPVWRPPAERLYGYQAFFFALVFPLSAAVTAFPKGLIAIILWLPCWLANVVYVRGLFALAEGRRNRALWAGLLATGLAASILLTTDKVPAAFGVGYWSWSGSMALLALAGIGASEGPPSTAEVP